MFSGRSEVLRGIEGKEEEKTGTQLRAGFLQWAWMSKIPRALYLHIVLAHEHVISLVFSHPDYTVGPGTSPDHTPLYREWLAGSTADQELEMQLTCLPSPCPEDISLFNCDVSNNSTS
jgi:hypothetical protein